VHIIYRRFSNQRHRYQSLLHCKPAPSGIATVNFLQN